MIYKKLKDLTDEALRDGELTVEEESRLMARAREMGQDLDEFRSYLEAERKSRVAYLAEEEKRRQERENRPAYVKLSEEIARTERIYSNLGDWEYLIKGIKGDLAEVVIPTDNEGLFQLANFLFSKYSHGKCKWLYKARLSECINAGLLSFPSDERFKSLETAFTQLKIKRLGILAGSVIVIILTIIILANVL